MDGTNGLKEATAGDRACRAEHAWCERFYGTRKDHGRRAGQSLWANHSALTLSRRL